MTRIIVFDTPTAEVREFRRKPGGKKERVIKRKDWKDDPKQLRKEAEKL